MVLKFFLGAAAASLLATALPATRVLPVSVVRSLYRADVNRNVVEWVTGARWLVDALRCLEYGALLADIAKFVASRLVFFVVVVRVTMVLILANASVKKGAAPLMLQISLCQHAWRAICYHLIHLIGHLLVLA